MCVRVCVCVYGSGLLYGVIRVMKWGKIDPSAGIGREILDESLYKK